MENHFRTINVWNNVEQMYKNVEYRLSMQSPDILMTALITFTRILITSVSL